ncbi:MAG: PIN domain-containing protein [Isosphaeraceae bacterium]
MEEVRRLSSLIDVNILLDVFLAREPWVADGQAIWAAHHRGRFNGYVAAHGLTNLFYIARKVIGTDKAREAVRLCWQTFEVCPIGHPELEQADALAGSDLEDNLVIACAMAANLDAIVTRNPKDFAGSPLPVLSPSEWLECLPKEDPA